MTRKPRFQRGRQNWGHSDGSNHRSVGRRRPAEPQCAPRGQEGCCHRDRRGDACQDDGRRRRPGQDRCREDRARQDRARERHSGQDRPGQGSRGQARGRQVGSHEDGADQGGPGEGTGRPQGAPARRGPRPRVRSSCPPYATARSRGPTEELAEIRTELEEQARELRGEIDDAEIAWHELQRDSGDGAGDDQADAGTKTFEREHELSLANNSRELLAQVDRALSRIDNGTYGVCENCGQPIGQGSASGLPSCDPVRDMQTTRGASLSDVHPPSTAARTERPPTAEADVGRRRRIALLAAVAVTVIVARPAEQDAIVVARMTENETRDVVGTLLRSTYTRNAGAAFSIGDGHDRRLHAGRASRWRWRSSVRRAGCAACGGRSRSACCSAARSATWATGCSATPGFLRGHVVDWIELPHWPVFNLADSAIVCGGVIAVLLSSRGIQVDGTHADARIRRPPSSRRERAGRGRRAVTDRRTLPVPDGLEGSASTPRCPACSGCPVRPPPTWSPAASRRSTARPAASPTGCSAGSWLEVDAAGAARRRSRPADAGRRA